MKIPRILTGCLTTLLAAGSVLAGSRNSENLLGPTGKVGQPSNKGIAITKVEKGSPADGRIRPGDVILGVGKNKFNRDARLKFADAIDEAETTEAGGKLTLMLEGNRTVELQLKVMGRYSDTAPYDCPKSEAIIRQAADYLIQPAKAKGKTPQFNAGKGQLQTGWLGLMATGDPKYIDFVKQNLPLQDWAKPNRDDLMARVKGDEPMSYVGWFWGYQLITLAEYHLLTGDKSVLPGIESYAEALANGQDAAGLWSHRMAIWSKNNGQPHGRCIGYGQMNQPSLTCFMGLLLAKKCGVKNAEVDGAIKRSHDYFNSYTSRGTFPYGVIKDQDLTYHSYHNPTKAVGNGIAILAGFNIKEGLDYTIALGETESGKGSFKMRAMMDSLARYGVNARPYVEQLKQLPGWQKVPDNPKLRGNWGKMIKAMEEDKDPATLITLEEAMAPNHTNP